MSVCVAKEKQWTNYKKKIMQFAWNLIFQSEYKEKYAYFFDNQNLKNIYCHAKKMFKFTPPPPSYDSLVNGGF